MGLIKCPDCNNVISDRADMCPKCGCPMTDEIKSQAHRVTPSQNNTIDKNQKIEDGKSYAQGQWEFERPGRRMGLIIAAIGLLVIIVTVLNLKGCS